MADEHSPNASPVAPADPAGANKSSVLICVCTLNEAENIGRLLRELRHAMPDADILVVDDCSDDATGGIVREQAALDPAISLHVRRDERGLGNAIRHAMSFAIDNDYTFLLNLDGDFSHDPRQLPGLLRRAKQEPPIDVVVGSRYVTGGSVVGWPLRRRLMSRLVNRFATFCLRLPVRDCSGSMRCYRVAALRACDVHNLQSSGYSVLEEILLRLHRGQNRFAEVPITFTERQLGESKLTFREAIRSAGSILMMAIRG